MPPLEGTERVAWDIRCRRRILATACTALVIEGDAVESAWVAIEDKNAQHHPCGLVDLAARLRAL